MEGSKEEYFINILKDDISIVKELPPDIKPLDAEAIGSQITDAVLAKEATVAEYIKTVLPLLLKNRVVHVLGYANRLGFDPMPSDIQICPSCKESLGEDAIRMVQNSSFPISQQGIWNPRRNGASHVHWELHDKKDASWEPNKHEPVPDSISPASRDNVYLPSLNDILSDDEDTISNASDVVVAENTSIAKRLY